MAIDMIFTKLFLDLSFGTDKVFRADPNALIVLQLPFVLNSPVQVDTSFFNITHQIVEFKFSTYFMKLFFSC